MADEQKGAQALTTAGSQAVAPAGGTAIKLGDVSTIDTAGLTPEQVQALKMQHAQGLIDIQKKAHELKVDVAALGGGLNTMAQSTKDVSEAGNSVTISHSMSTSFGRTEVMMGNTDTASKGKLSRSQAGLKDMTMYYVVIAAVVVVVLALILMHH